MSQSKPLFQIANSSLLRVWVDLAEVGDAYGGGGWLWRWFHSSSSSSVVGTVHCHV